MCGYRIWYWKLVVITILSKYCRKFGYKCLTMMLSDGVSQLFLDFSLHGEEGKDKQKVQGLTAK